MGQRPGFGLHRDFPPALKGRDTAGRPRLAGAHARGPYASSGFAHRVQARRGEAPPRPYLLAAQPHVVDGSGRYASGKKVPAAGNPEPAAACCLLIRACATHFNDEAAYQPSGLFPSGPSSDEDHGPTM